MGRKRSVPTGCFRPKANDHGVEFGMALEVFVMTFLALTSPARSVGKSLHHTVTLR